MIEQCRAVQGRVNSIYDNIVAIYINEMRRTFGTKNNTPYCRWKFRHTPKEWWDEELTEPFRNIQKAEKAEQNFIKDKYTKQKFKEMRIFFQCKQKHFNWIVKNRKIANRINVSS